MGIEIEELKKAPCKCFQIGPSKEAHNLMCFRKGVIGTLTDEQETRLCDIKDIKPPTPALKKRINEFTEAIHAAQERYKGEGIRTWLELVGQETRKRGIEL